VVHQQLLELCIALAPFSLPPYVTLEIFDWLPMMRLVRHGLKIALIVGVQKSLNRMKGVVV
jgi:hypothetical protein